MCAYNKYECEEMIEHLLDSTRICDLNSSKEIFDLNVVSEPATTTDCHVSMNETIKRAGCCRGFFSSGECHQHRLPSATWVILGMFVFGLYCCLQFNLLALSGWWWRVGGLRQHLAPFKVNSSCDFATLLIECKLRHRRIAVVQ